VPYFPEAYAISPDRRLEFNFANVLMDSLELPCPINGTVADDGPVIILLLYNRDFYAKRQIGFLNLLEKRQINVKLLRIKTLVVHYFSR
jgi:hypothetical protein